MSDDVYVRPDLSQLPDVMAIINLALDSWEAVRDSCGPEVAGDPVRDMATALLLAGYKRVTI
jgi:hypothetical protein